MTNDTELHQNGVADDLAAIAAPSSSTSTESPASTETGTETSAAPAEVEAAAAAQPAPPAEPAPPSFDDLGLHPDVKLALDEMGYLLPTPVQTAV